MQIQNLHNYIHPVNKAEMNAFSRDHSMAETEFNQVVREANSDAKTQSSNTQDEKHTAEMLAPFRADLFTNANIMKARLNEN